MKQRFIKFPALFSLLILLFSSCLKDDSEEPTLIIDPSPWYSYSAVWQESERKTGSDSEPLPDGNKLSLWWDYSDSTKTNFSGEYRYNSENLDLVMDTAGYINARNGLLSFINVINGQELDTVATVRYVSDDTAFTILDTAATPNIEIKYNKID